MLARSFCGVPANRLKSSQWYNDSPKFNLKKSVRETEESKKVNYLLENTTMSTIKEIPFAMMTASVQTPQRNLY